MKAGGFTLVELMVALAVGSLLLVGVTGATRASLEASRLQRREAGRDPDFERAAELLRSDWRGRIKVRGREVSAQGVRSLVLETSADAIGVRATRGVREVVYEWDEKGLRRLEPGASHELLKGPVELDLWVQNAWRPKPEGAVLAMRLKRPAPGAAPILIR